MSGESRLTGVLGAMLIAFGALVTWLCGTCTWAVLGQGHSTPNPSDLAFVLIIGGLPTLFGITTMVVGVIFVVRAADRQRPPRNPDGRKP